MNSENILVIASRNKKKREEILALLDNTPCRVLTLDDFPDCPEVQETGQTFGENAILKAVAVAVFTGQLTLADDSGLEVDTLAGAPGVHSARFASGEKDQGNAGDKANLELLLEKLSGIPEERRSARFVCAMALARPEGKNGAKVIAETRGTVEGRITDRPCGSRGFGYDPVFLIPEYGKTFGQLGAEVKQKISHRARALEAMKEKIFSEFL